MSFTPTNFQDLPSTATPIDAVELNKLGTQHAAAVADSAAQVPGLVDNALTDGGAIQTFATEAVDTSLAAAGEITDAVVETVLTDPTSQSRGALDATIAAELDVEVPPRVATQIDAQIAPLVDQVTAARDEVVVAVAAQSDWTGAVTLAQTESKSSFLRRRLNGSVVVTVSSGEAGFAYSCSLELVQDAVGSRTLTLPNVRAAYGLPIVLSTAPGAIDVVRLEWDGSTWTAYLGAVQLSIPASWAV